MLKIGEFNDLTALRKTSVGIFLGIGDDNDVLLPNRYVTPEMKIGDNIKVFIYTDSEDRLVATTETPKVTVGHFAFLKVKDSSRMGAFLDWGLPKDLFVPSGEQKHPMKPGNSYVVFVYLDEQSNRLVGSSRISEFLDNTDVAFANNEAVDLFIYEKTDLGYNAIINDYFKGLVYNNEIFKPIAIGTRIGGFIKQIREDKAIDLSLQPLGFQNLEESAEQLLQYLQKNKGFLALTDNSSPDDIYSTLQMSKKTFKRGIGILYKQKRIALKENGIQLL
ncbi:MAG: S1-like domain-containing RNA-binding protein [Bacteroidota bacterium]